MPPHSDIFLTQLTSHAIELYSLPKVALELVRLADLPEVDMRALRQCIENDPALAAKILKTANSSMFGRGRKVGDLNQAIGVLGVKPLKLLALGFSLPKDLVDGQENEVLTEYWRRSLLKAAAAREICRCWWNVDGDDAFVAGLLQDVGALVLLRMLGFAYEEVLAEAYAKGEDPRSSEVAAFGFDRTAVSVRLLCNWGLPADLVEAIGDGNLAPLQPDALDEGAVSRRPSSDGERLRSALRLANLFVDVLRGGDKTRLARLLTEAARSGNVTWEQIESLAAELQQATRQLTDILALPKPVEVDYALFLERAHQQLAGLAADAAADLARANQSPAPTGEQFVEQCVEQHDRSVVRLAAVARAWPSTGAAPRRARLDGVASSLSSAHSASRDYAHDPVLIDRAAIEIEKCRRTRSPISLALVAIDDFERVLLARGPQGLSAVMRMVDRALDAASDGAAGRLQLDDRCYAVLLPACDKSAALRVARLAMQGLERWSAAERGADLVTLSAGLATLPAPAKGFPTPELIVAAARCLTSAQSAGGRACKSIDIF